VNVVFSFGPIEFTEAMIASEIPAASKQRFGGEKFDPTERGHGANWARWKRAADPL
jgi:hypothetical protein